MNRKALLRKFPNYSSIAFLIEQAKIKVLFNLFTSELVGYYLLERPMATEFFCQESQKFLCLRSSPFYFKLLYKTFDSKSKTLVDGSNGTRDDLETYFMEEIDLRRVWSIRGHVRTD